MKFKIPNIKKKKADTPPAADNADEIFNELEQAEPTEYAQQTDKTVSSKTSSFFVSEVLLRKIWAGEIAFGILAAFAAVIIAFAG